LSFIVLPRRPYRPEPQDIWSAALFLSFALFSLIWPNTGVLRLGALSLPRGYLVAAALGLSGALALLLGTREFSGAPRVLRFFRCLYPQAYFAPLFIESIILSSQPWGGPARDALFAAADLSIFGFQPAREFSLALGRLPPVNELMFAAYFSFYFVVVLTPWIPFLKGDEAEARRESSILAGFMLVAYVTYVFFRVVGPKHYLPDLVATGYRELKGGIFTAIEEGILGAAITTGAAFPSSHVAVSLMMTSFTARTAPRLFPLYVLDACLIGAATVYIYAHWAVDVAAGALAAALLVPLFGLLHDRLLGAGTRPGLSPGRGSPA
jgi:membrane-associated phospholipid phosphatase